MRDSIKKAIGSTVQDMLDGGIVSKTSFTKKELNALNIKIPAVQLSTSQIKEIRKEMNLSQAVFAKLLNVSPSSIRQWEQGKRKPSGSTKVLLELLKKTPHLLDYRLSV
jgi:putative transcriptional regulator